LPDAMASRGEPRLPEPADLPHQNGP